MYGTLLNHSAKEVREALRNNCFNVYWNNVLVNTKWRVIDVRTRAGELHVRVLHPIHAGWYAVDTKDILSFQ